MAEWNYAQHDPSEQLAMLHFFSMMKDGVEFKITVREYYTPKDATMKFVAQADKQTNQKTTAITPSGWGPTLGEALSQCMRMLAKFPYEGER
jgi:hypothetical protein